MVEHNQPHAGAGADPAAPRIEVIFSEAEIAEQVDRVAAAIAAEHWRQLLVVPILTGSFVFAADLIRQLHRAGLSPEIDFLSLSSYRKSSTSSGKVDILRDVELEVRGRDVLIVDDVLESGRTLAYAKDLISARGARRVATCVLLDKQSQRAVQIVADHVAFLCPPVFVVGYGMDVAYRYRQLPYIGRVVEQSQ